MLRFRGVADNLTPIPSVAILAYDVKVINSFVIHNLHDHHVFDLCIICLKIKKNYLAISPPQSD